MCIAIVKKPDGVVTRARLLECFNRNRDGAGFAYLNKDRVILSKGHMTFDEFYAAYEKKLAEFPESTFLIHFRIATSGPADKTNTHPFFVAGGALIHNGVLFSPPTGTQRSDTNIFAEWMSRRLTDQAAWLLNKEKVEQLIGDYNKIAVLFKDNTFLICNEKAGSWDNNVWYSNTYSYTSGSGWMGSQHGPARAPLTLGYHQSRSIN